MTVDKTTIGIKKYLQYIIKYLFQLKRTDFEEPFFTPFSFLFNIWKNLWGFMG